MKQLSQIRKMTYSISVSFLFVTPIVGTALATPAPASADVVRDCGFPANFDRGAPIFDISARNMTCSPALGKIHRRRWRGGRYEVAGWSCYVVRWEGIPGLPHAGAIERCARRSQAFRFSWGP